MTSSSAAVPETSVASVLGGLIGWTISRAWAAGSWQVAFAEPHDSSNACTAMCCYAMCQCQDVQTLPDGCITSKAIILRAWLPSRYHH